MDILGKELSTTIAVREAREFHKKLTWEVIGGQLIMLTTLGLMAYFDVSVAWMVAAAYAQASGPPKCCVQNGNAEVRSLLV